MERYILIRSPVVVLEFIYEHVASSRAFRAFRPTPDIPKHSALNRKPGPRISVRLTCAHSRGRAPLAYSRSSWFLHWPPHSALGGRGIPGIDLIGFGS